MEVVLILLVGLCFGIGFLLDKAKEFIQQLKSSGTTNLSKGFKAELSVVPIDEKKKFAPLKKQTSKNDTD